MNKAQSFKIGSTTLCHKATVTIHPGQARDEGEAADGALRTIAKNIEVFAER